MDSFSKRNTERHLKKRFEFSSSERLSNFDITSQENENNEIILDVTGDDLHMDFSNESSNESNYKSEQRSGMDEMTSFCSNFFSENRTEINKEPIKRNQEDRFNTESSTLGTNELVYSSPGVEKAKDHGKALEFKDNDFELPMSTNTSGNLSNNSYSLSKGVKNFEPPNAPVLGSTRVPDLTLGSNFKLPKSTTTSDNLSSNCYSFRQGIKEFEPPNTPVPGSTRVPGSTLSRDMQLPMSTTTYDSLSNNSYSFSQGKKEFESSYAPVPGSTRVLGSTIGSDFKLPMPTITSDNISHNYYSFRQGIKEFEPPNAPVPGSTRVPGSNLGSTVYGFGLPGTAVHPHMYMNSQSFASGILNSYNPYGFESPGLNHPSHGRRSIYWPTSDQTINSGQVFSNRARSHPNLSVPVADSTSFVQSELTKTKLLSSVYKPK